ncbi:DUF4253 domain-containing protein [Streptomyces sp. NPDC002888]|uniref:DUF4253 domain-containing protein n=1 Tax=Streptomyces sp. NPDC002888 TaxID=3364668 RepID=UPI0036C7ED13
MRLETVLAADFAEYRRRRLPAWSDPTPVEMPEGLEPWPHDPGPPFESRPGLAAAVRADDGSATPTESAAHTVARLMGEGPYGLEDCVLALVPARRSADVPAAVGWSADAPLPLLCALLRSWEERFGARVVAGFGAELHVTADHHEHRDLKHRGVAG